MTDTNIVKVVVPSFGLKGAFERVELNRNEFELLQEDYLAEQLALLETISTRDNINEIHIETARMLLDKMIPPFQYWLENEFACNRINRGDPKPVDPHTRKVLEQAAEQRAARNAAEGQVDSGFNPSENSLPETDRTGEGDSVGESHGPPSSTGRL